jgi:hypothetical protein
MFPQVWELPDFLKMEPKSFCPLNIPANSNSRQQCAADRANCQWAHGRTMVAQPLRMDTAALRSYLDASSLTNPRTLEESLMMNSCQGLVFGHFAKATEGSQPLFNEHSRIRATNGLKLHTLGPLSHNEKEPLGIQGCKKLPMLIQRAYPIEQAKGGMIEILLSSNRGLH